MHGDLSAPSTPTDRLADRSTEIRRAEQYANVLWPHFGGQTGLRTRGCTRVDVVYRTPSVDISACSRSAMPFISDRGEGRGAAETAAVGCGRIDAGLHTTIYQRLAAANVCVGGSGVRVGVCTFT